MCLWMVYEVYGWKRLIKWDMNYDCDICCKL